MCSSINPPSIVGLDVGRKRVGIALYHPEKAVITPLKSVDRAGKRAEQAVLQLSETHDVSLIVLGVPLSAGDESTEQGNDITAFAERLRRRCAIPIHFQDEYLSSEEAKELLGISGSPHRSVRESGIIDAVAAGLILQRFLLGEGRNPSLDFATARRQLRQLISW